MMLGRVMGQVFLMQESGSRFGDVEGDCVAIGMTGKTALLSC